MKTSIFFFFRIKNTQSDEIKLYYNTYIFVYMYMEVYLCMYI